MVWGSEKDITKRGRMVILVVLWAIAIPLFVGLWQLAGWWTLIGVGACAWGTWDYAKKGDMFGTVEPVGRAGEFLPGAFKENERRHP